MIPTGWPLVALLWCGTMALAGWWGYGAGRDAEIATQAREDKATLLAAEVAASAAAHAISRLRIQHRTITQEVQREIVDRPVYRDCGHSAEQLQRINAAIVGEPGRAADRGELPASDPAR